MVQQLLLPSYGAAGRALQRTQRPIDPDEVRLPLRLGVLCDFRYPQRELTLLPLLAVANQRSNATDDLLLTSARGNGGGARRSSGCPELSAQLLSERRELCLRRDW
jgi:hypothetical protein